MYPCSCAGHTINDMKGLEKTLCLEFIEHEVENCQQSTHQRLAMKTYYK